MKRHRHDSPQNLPAAKRRKINPIETKVSIEGLLQAKLTGNVRYSVNLKHIQVNPDVIDLLKQRQAFITGLHFSFDTEPLPATQYLQEIECFQNLRRLRLPGRAYGTGFPQELLSLLAHPNLNGLEHLKINIQDPFHPSCDCAAKMLILFAILPKRLKSLTIYTPSFLKDLATFRSELKWTQKPWFPTLYLVTWSNHHAQKYLEQIGNLYQKKIIEDIISSDYFRIDSQELKITFISDLTLSSDSTNPDTGRPQLEFQGEFTFNLKKNSYGKWEYTKSWSIKNSTSTLLY